MLYMQNLGSKSQEPDMPPVPLAGPIIQRPMQSKCNQLLSEMETDYIITGS